MKIFIKEEYAGIILQLAHKYINENPGNAGCNVYHAMAKTLETMDIYVAYINNMGFMMYDYSIKAMVQYISEINDTDVPFAGGRLEEIGDYLAKLI